MGEVADLVKIWERDGEVVGASWVVTQFGWRKVWMLAGERNGEPDHLMRISARQNVPDRFKGRGSDSTFMEWAKQQALKLPHKTVSD